MKNIKKIADAIFKVSSWSIGVMFRSLAFDHPKDVVKIFRERNKVEIQKIRKYLIDEFRFENPSWLKEQTSRTLDRDILEWLVREGIAAEGILTLYPSSQSPHTLQNWIDLGLPPKNVKKLADGIEG